VWRPSPVVVVTEGVCSNLVYVTLAPITVTVSNRHLAVPNAVAFSRAPSVWRTSCFELLVVGRLLHGDQRGKVKGRVKLISTDHEPSSLKLSFNDLLIGVYRPRNGRWPAVAV
jgi:hypothetical protein